MSESLPPVGAIQWCDLTVPNASQVRDFYSAVTGWTSTGLDMDGYEDFCMNRPDDGTTVAGICHARGSNAGIPAAWLVYINVADLDRSLDEVRSRGGSVQHGPREMGGGRMAIIKDPAGAVCALFQHGTSQA